MVGLGSTARLDKGNVDQLTVRHKLEVHLENESSSDTCGIWEAENIQKITALFHSWIPYLHGLSYYVQSLRNLYFQIERTMIHYVCSLHQEGLFRLNYLPVRRRARWMSGQKASEWEMIDFVKYSRGKESHAYVSVLARATREQRAWLAFWALRKETNYLYLETLSSDLLVAVRPARGASVRCLRTFDDSPEFMR